ncbi:DMT family transporter [Rheinheimera sp. SA_1]|uniref:DMT family transporter n=1 Tax=Rheinheimera sp. SA_1 TaxID=1827365 RepID=UPI0009ED2281|nr:DMT family transporter [Rheinheimera sp. SA_1]
MQSVNTQGESASILIPGTVVIPQPAATPVAPVAATTNAAPIPAKQLAQGMFWGALGVLMFSGGIPATRLAVAELPVMFVGAGRALVAALLSVLLLVALRQKIPARQHWPALAVVAFGAVFAYPIFSAIAMQTIDASHGTLISSIMPLFTAIFGAWLSRQWPRVGFWLCALIGTAAVMLYAASSAAGELSWALSTGDLWLVLACFCCGLSYAQGGLLARHIGSWQVICWALVLSLPLLLPLCWYFRPVNYDISLNSWLGFGYLAIFSMFLGFFAWYKGLALGGVAQVSQLQLLTTFLAFCWAALWLGESISLSQWLMAGVVVLSIAIGRKLA